MSEVDCKYKAKGVLRMLGYLMWHATSGEVGMLIYVLLQNWKSDARQELEHMEEFALEPVTSGRELHGKLLGEVHWKHGWLGVAMEWGHLK
jgi:hypothetical protein